MSLHFKEDVKIFGLQPEILWALDRIEEVFEIHGRQCTVTSARGDVHKKHSHHYKGLAIDIRTRHLVGDEPNLIVSQIKQVLGEDYDVVLESTHLHVEYDPAMKPQYT